METKVKLGIQSQWYNNEQTIIYTEINAPWSWEDVEANLVQILAMAQSVTYPLGLIVFLPDDLSIPPSGFSQASRQVARTHTEAEFAIIVYVIPNAGIKTLWQETIGAFAPDPSRYHLVDTLDAALKLLQ